MRTKILTVDDSKTVRIIVKRAFRNLDCEIIEASNGAEGLKVASEQLPSLMLVDVTMPIMDGIELVRRLKADPRLKDIAVVMLTAEGGRDAIQKACMLGVTDYIVKPFAEAALLDKVGKIVVLAPLAQAV